MYTSENSRPMYPEPMMATHGGIQSSFSAPSDVNTVLGQGRPDVARLFTGCHR